jgi:CheY-like chemotaxis protein
MGNDKWKMKGQEAMKLLIVDDNPEMRRLLRRLLASLADDITECEDGDRVLAAYEDAQPDWVLMDIRMKAMGGLAATRLLLTHWPQARVVIVTSFNDDVLREEARQAGALGYVLKENLFDVRRLLHPPKTPTA